MASRPQRTEERIRLTLVDDHQLLRAGVRTLLEEEPDLEVAAEVAHGNDICALIRRIKVDVLLLDLDMPPPDGHEVLRQMKKSRLGVPTIILTGVDDPLSLTLALELGAKGIVPKKSATKQLIQAVRRVHQGGPWLEESLAHLKPHGLQTPQPAPPRQKAHVPLPATEISLWSSLTPRERQIALLVAQGQRYKEIASHLSISDQTVRNHLRNVFDKLQVKDRVQLALYTIRRGQQQSLATSLRSPVRLRT